MFIRKSEGQRASTWSSSPRRSLLSTLVTVYARIMEFLNKRGGGSYHDHHHIITKYVLRNHKRRLAHRAPKI